MDFDQNLYSRQLGAFGVEAMGKLITLKVYIQGLRGLGIEVAKNLILAGPKKVVIQDDTLIQNSDLGSNFYLTKPDGKTTRAQASLKHLKDLNYYVDVSIHEKEITTDFLKEFDVVVFTDFYDKKLLAHYNNFCRSQEKPIGFIYAGSLGLYGFTFVDFGSKFICFDTNGEDPRSAIIANITNEENAVVTTHEDKRHGFEEGDHVVFKEVKGMEEINGKVFPIKVLSPYQFSIGDTTKFGKYIRDGIVEQVKTQKVISFKSFEESLKYPLDKEFPPLETPDLDKWGRSEFLHLAFTALLEFATTHGRLPELNNQEEAEAYSKLVLEVHQENKNKMDIEGAAKVDEINDSLLNIAKNIALFARTNLTTHVSFWGGIVAQEIVKFTGKFMPIRQWLHYENFELLPEGPVDRTLTDCRYDDQIAVYGKEFQEKLMKQKYFLVGAGALGCEFIKMFALMGLACGKDGKLTVTDDDNIEISNLNRQFLFRKENVGQSKSQTAAEVGKSINPHLNVDALKLRVAPENEEVFNDEFWEGLDAVTNAVDNVHARLYVDGRCVFYAKHLFESGTLGTKCNSQVIVPFYTQSYGESQDPPEESIPLCTLKNFPYQIEHTIQWARDFFEGTFVEGPNECNKYLESPSKYIESVRKELRERQSLLRQRLETIKKITTEFQQASHERCVLLAREIYQEIFYNNIAQLLHNFPADHKTESGAPFWSGPRRLPKPIPFDSKDEACLNFVVAAANLFAFIFRLTPLKDTKFVAEIAENYHPKSFEPKKAKISENQNANVENVFEDDEIVINELTQILQSTSISKSQDLQGIEFEKDDDTNYHIDFIAATANLRARNYSIPEASRYKIKMIAGKIIPAIATTTAMVVGIVGFEITKFVLGKKPELFRNSFSNLAIPLWLFSEPMPPNKKVDKDYDPLMLGPVKAIPPGFTVWDFEKIQGPLTLKEIMDYYNKKYGVSLTIISSGKICLYNKYDKMNKSMPGRLQQTPTDLYKALSQKDLPKFKKFLEIEVSGETADGIDCIFPSLRYEIH